LNVRADEYFLNDIDSRIIKLHEKLNKYTNKEKDLFDDLFKIIDTY
jgi:hypothetical protein